MYHVIQIILQLRPLYPSEFWRPILITIIAFDGVFVVKLRGRYIAHI